MTAGVGIVTDYHSITEYSIGTPKPETLRNPYAKGASNVSANEAKVWVAVCVRIKNDQSAILDRDHFGGCGEAMISCDGVWFRV